MSLFKHSYSGLITGGLGMPACCGLITMGFSLFKCTIEVIEPPQPSVFTGGGGGSVGQSTGHNVPFLQSPTLNKSKIINITVVISEKTWKKSYTVNTNKADLAVKVINILNKTTDRINVIISNIIRHKNTIITKWLQK